MLSECSISFGFMFFFVMWDKVQTRDGVRLSDLRTSSTSSESGGGAPKPCPIKMPSILGMVHACSRHPKSMKKL